MAVGAQGHPGFVDCLAECRAGSSGFAGYAHTVFVRAVLLQICGDRNHHVIVEALAQGLALLLANSDHLVGPAIQADLAAQGIDAGHEVLDNVSAHDCHR